MRNIISSEYWCRCVMIMTTNIKYCGFVYRDVEHDDNDRQSDYHPWSGEISFPEEPKLVLEVPKLFICLSESKLGLNKLNNELRNKSRQAKNEDVGRAVWTLDG